MAGGSYAQWAAGNNGDDGFDWGKLLAGIGVGVGGVGLLSQLFDGDEDPEDKFAELAKYYQQFTEQMYGGMDLLTADETSMFEAKAESIAKREKQLTESAMSNLAARGMVRGGVGSEFISRNVTTPTAEAYSALDFARTALERQESSKRQAQALQFAASKYTEIQQAEAEKSGFLGKLFGTVLGAGAGFLVGGPAGMGVGASVGGGLFGGDSGGEGGMDAQMMMMLKFIQQNPDASFEDWFSTIGGNT